MLVTGDVKCLHCGFISGRWLGENGAPITVSGMRDRSSTASLAEDDLARCARCDGSVFLDEVDLVVSSTRLRRIRRLREQIAAFETLRRGRAA